MHSIRSKIGLLISLTLAIAAILTPHWTQHFAADGTISSTTGLFQYCESLDIKGDIRVYKCKELTSSVIGDHSWNYVQACRILAILATSCFFLAFIYEFIKSQTSSSCKGVVEALILVAITSMTACLVLYVRKLQRSSLTPFITVSKGYSFYLALSSMITAILALISLLLSKP